MLLLKNGPLLPARVTFQPRLTNKRIGIPFIPKLFTESLLESLPSPADQARLLAIRTKESGLCLVSFHLPTLELSWTT
ncbi:hypothetical protein C0J52_08753 [Blattella germanica]|nr:hypothetical protein C0J52_08753 [Blattella germanica]